MCSNFIMLTLQGKAGFPPLARISSSTFSQTSMIAYSLLLGFAFPREFRRRILPDLRNVQVLPYRTA